MERPRIGAFVLETLTTGMYTDPLDSLREYVQNSFDSIRRAESEGVIAPREGRIEICYEGDLGTVAVVDNGLGIKTEEAPSRLLDIGISSKEIEQDAGFRGIGRLAGIAYCERLLFRTSFQGEPRRTVVSFDAIGLRRAMSTTARHEAELHEVIRGNSTVRTEDAPKSDHYFEVLLEGLTEEASDFTDVKALNDYMSQVAPVGFDSQRFTPATIIEKWTKDRGITIQTAALILKDGEGNERQVFKPYTTHYTTSAKGGGGALDVEIRDVQFYPPDRESQAKYWIWYGVSDLLGSINEPSAAGFRMRQNNIMVGDETNMAAIFAESAPSNRRFNKYYIGEVHILSKSVIPNARRDGFEARDDWPEIHSQLRGFVDKRREDIRETSGSRNLPVKKFESLAKKAIAKADKSLDTGVASDKERNSLVTALETEITRGQAALTSTRKPEETKKIEETLARLRSKKTDVESAPSLVGKRPYSGYSRKQRKVLADALEVVYDVLSKRPCKQSAECCDEVKKAIDERFGGTSTKEAG